MKLRTLLIGVLPLSTILMVACSNGTQEGSNANDGVVTIEYWHPNADTQGGQTVTQLTEEFNASQDEIEVVPVFNEGMYQGLMQNLQTAVAGGDTPALVQIGWSYREYFANNFDYVSPEEVIQEHSPEDAGYLNEKFPENIYALSTLNNGHQLGTPYSVSVPVLHVNLEILEEAGVNPDSLTSWQAVREAAKQIANQTEYEGLYIAEAADNWNVQSMIESNGGKVITDDQATFAGSNGLETYQFYQDMIKEGSALHTNADQGQQAFVSGEVGMAHLTIAQRANIVNNGSFNAAAVPSPPFEGEEVNLPAGGSQLVVTAQDPDHQQAAWEFMKFLYQPDQIAAWVEGTGYVPPTTDATENAEIEQLLTEDPIFVAASSQLDKIVEWAPFPGDSGLQAEQKLIDLRDRVLGGANVQEEVPTTEDEINALIEK